MRFRMLFSVCACALAAACQITPDDNLNEPLVADASNDNAVIRFDYILHSDANYDNIDWESQDVWGMSPASAEGLRALPVLYRARVNLSEAANLGQNTLLFDKIDAQSVSVMANRSLVQSNYVDPARNLYNLNPYLRVGPNEIIVLCVPKGPVDFSGETALPLLLQNGRLTVDANADSVIPLTWEVAEMPGMTEKWYDTAESSENIWTPFVSITRLLEYHKPAPIYVTPQWITYPLEVSRPADVRLPRDLVINRTNWNSIANWYKLEFKLPAATNRSWELVLQTAGSGYGWLNGSRIEASKSGLNIVRIPLDPALLKPEGSNTLIFCNLPIGGVPEIVSAEIRPQ